MMVLHLQAADDPPRPDPLAKFFAIMWEHFVDGCSIDGCDLQDAIEASGMGVSRETTQEDIDSGVDYLEIGDDITVLTAAGRAAIEAAKRAT